MSPVLMKPNVVNRIVKLKSALKRWRNTAVAPGCVPSYVPSGHIVVYVGAGFKRFVVRAAYLNHPLFKHLLAQAEEEFGFVNQGPLVIPCDESEFEEALRSASSTPAASIELIEKRCYRGSDFFSDPVLLAHHNSIN
ncbi:unnamed protein product [Rhodiola kirilowii]